MLKDDLQFKEFVFHVTYGDRLLFTTDDAKLASKIMQKHFPGCDYLIVPIAVFKEAEK